MTLSSHLSKPSLVGQQIGSWLLEKKLGEGGTASVYAGQHAFLSKRAAIKILLPQYCNDPQKLKRFQREAQAVERLNHPNIVQLHDFGWDEKHGFFMVQELLEGYDLEWAIQNAPLKCSYILKIAEQICSGLTAAHDAQVIHRDLKPTNIFLIAEEAPHPKIKILDFGIAKLQPDKEQQELENLTVEEKLSKLTGEKIILGTLTHIAPEQSLSSKEVTPQVDTYAFGVLLYQLFTGHLPIQGVDPMEHMLMLLTQAPPPVSKYREELKGSDLEKYLDRLLAKEPENRPESMQKAWEELKEASESFDDPLEEFEDPMIPQRTQIRPVKDVVPVENLVAEKLATKKFVPPSPVSKEPEANKDETPSIFGRSLFNENSTFEQEEDDLLPPPPQDATGPFASSQDSLVSTLLEDESSPLGSLIAPSEDLSVDKAEKKPDLVSSLVGNEKDLSSSLLAPLVEGDSLDLFPAVKNNSEDEPAPENALISIKLADPPEESEDVPSKEQEAPKQKEAKAEKEGEEESTTKAQEGEVPPKEESAEDVQLETSEGLPTQTLESESPIPGDVLSAVTSTVSIEESDEKSKEAEESESQTQEKMDSPYSAANAPKDSPYSAAYAPKKTDKPYLGSNKSQNATSANPASSRVSPFSVQHTQNPSETTPEPPAQPVVNAPQATTPKANGSSFSNQISTAFMETQPTILEPSPPTKQEQILDSKVPEEKPEVEDDPNTFGEKQDMIVLERTPLHLRDLDSTPPGKKKGLKKWDMIALVALFISLALASIILLSI